MKSILKTELHCTPASGANILSVTREAVVMALTEDRVVNFRFNDREFRVDPLDVISANYGTGG